MTVAFDPARVVDALAAGLVEAVAASHSSGRL